MWAEPVADAELEIVLRIENRTPCEDGLSRAGHWPARCSPPIRCCASTEGASPHRSSGPCGGANTFPVLAAADDSAVVGAAIVLPDHPQIAPESQGGLFDSTEIEEALLLHVRALSDAEREDRPEPTRRCGRWSSGRRGGRPPASSPGLHGRVTLRDPQTTSPPEAPRRARRPSARVRRRRRSTASPTAAATTCGSDRLPAPTCTRGCWTAASVTIERIFTDYDGKAHFGVTIDGDPGQQLLRETSRFLFFFAPELEVVE